jgi:ribonuclease HI
VDLPEDAVYFDAGTGRGDGTESNVTDRAGTPLAHLEAPAHVLTRFGTIRLSPGRTNNYGELLGCYYALKVARRLGVKKVLGDSALVLDYWSKGKISAEKRESDPDLVKLATLTARERRAFEAEGGSLAHVPGGKNPADLGFHRD